MEELRREPVDGPACPRAGRRDVRRVWHSLRSAGRTLTLRLPKANEIRSMDDAGRDTTPDARS